MKTKIPTFLRPTVRLWGLLTSAGVVACFATLFGFFGRSSWFLDLFSHFRVQYVLGLAVIGSILLAGRRRMTAVIFLAFACVNLGLVLPLYFGETRAVPQGANTLRAMLLNVNTSHGDVQRVRQVVEEVDPDILVLEEISSKWVSELAWLTNSHPHCHIQAREDNFGIGLFSKLPLAESKTAYIGSAGVPTILATVSTEETDLRVIATHPLPPGGRVYSRWRNEQLDQLSSHLCSPLPLILLGDLNTTPWNYHFRRLLRRSGLSDSSKGRGVQPTWPSNNPLMLIAIDHCLHSADITIVDRKIGGNVSSDHYPVIIDFVILAKPPDSQ